MRLLSRLTLWLLSAALACASAPAFAQSFNAQQQAEIRALVRDYLVNNPDVLKDAIAALDAREMAAREARILHDPRDFSVGPANARVTVVEFFDYRCPFCMRALPWMVNTLNTRRDVRFVFKELPIAALHGEPAVESARASLAAMPQGRYIAFYRALLGYPGDLTSQRIDLIARQVGIDVPTMRRRMNDPAITQHLADNHTLLVSAGEEATPAFLIDGKWYYGFGDGHELDAAIDTALRKAR
ncbi:MAG: DsbA family protein [Alphaproteobacteria bacterium]